MLLNLVEKASIADIQICRRLPPVPSRTRQSILQHLNLGVIPYLADRILHADRVHASCLSYPHGHVQPRRISPLRFCFGDMHNQDS
jgi:hypothetical protein